MIGLVNEGDSLRITDESSGDNGKIGVVDRVEKDGVRLVLDDGRKVRRSWGVERVTASREDRIAMAMLQAPKNATEERECLALGITVQVNADMLNLLLEENESLRKKLADTKDWMKCANQFAWAHERNCPRREGGDCNCGLDQFLGRPRPYIESWKSQLADLETRCKSLDEGALPRRTRIAELERQLSDIESADWKGVGERWRQECLTHRERIIALEKELGSVRKHYAESIDARTR